MLQEIGPALKTDDRLAIVVDADDDSAARWEAVRSALAGIAVPASPPPDGFVGAGARPATRVGVWPMPDNSGRGMLETFLATLVPDTDASWPETIGMVARAKDLGAPFKSADKARIHTWLAWQDPEGLPFGTAITSRALRHDSDMAKAFARWFRRVLIDE